MSAIGTFAGALGGVANGDPLAGAASGAADEIAGLGLRAIGSWVLDGTRAALEQVSHAIGAATAPNLDSTWFSSTYWRVAALAAMLTIPFLCAAAVQAVARADLSLLARAAFGHLPLSLLGVSLAAPLTMLLLAATDQMSAAVSASATTGGARFLDRAAVAAGAMASVGGSPFFAVLVGLFAVMAALALAVELLVRAAAVYVVVLMLPLAFAALVWPARRVWAVRLVELLVSLILSKFVIVAVLSLAGAALSSGSPGISQLLVAMSLLLLSTFAPWTLMRILPFTELAAGAAGLMRNDISHAHGRALGGVANAAAAGELALELPARLRRQASQTDEGFDAGFDGGVERADRSGFVDHGAGPAGQAASSGDQDAGVPGGHIQQSGRVDPSGQVEPGGQVDPSGQVEPGGQAERAGAAAQKTPYVPPDLSRDGQGVRLDAQLITELASRHSAGGGHPGIGQPQDHESTEEPE